MADVIKSIITRLDTTANWTTLNPTPANGEQCIEILKKGLFKLKIGDGVTPWIALKYATINGNVDELRVLLKREIEERKEGDMALHIALIDGLATKITHYSELPQITEANAGEVAQYIGETTEEFTENYFYKAIYDLENPENSHWERVSVQPETDLTPVWEAIEALDGKVDEKVEELNQKIEETAQELDEKKVTKTDDPLRIYGTDEDGNQVVYDKEDFGKVDDVKVKFAGSNEYESIVGIIEPKVASLDLTAGKVDYTFDATPNVTSIKDALDDLMNRQYYVAPLFNRFQITNNSTDPKTWNSSLSYERRTSAITYLEFRWTLNKTPAAGDVLQIRTGTSGGTSGTLIYDIMANEPSNNWKSGNYVLPNFTTTNTGKSYHIYYKDNHSVVPSGESDYTNANVSMSFFIYRYYGTSVLEELTDEQIRGLSYVNTSSRTLAQTEFNFGDDGKYLYFVIPKETQGNTPMSFFATKSDAPQINNYFIFEKNDFKNAQGYTIPVWIYKHKKSALGTPEKITGKMIYSAK